MTISSLLSDIADRYHLRRKSGKWVGACPECGGSNTSDKFNMRDDGGFKCYSCEFRGDIITWLRKKEGLSCPDAHERAGRDCRADSCQVRDKCRLGTGGGVKRKFQPSSVKPRAGRKVSALPITAVTAPRPLWLSWATDLVVKAQENIQQHADVLQWLADRGINQDAVKRFGLGWLDHSYQVKRATIGLPTSKDGKDKLWVPDGLLIPIYDRIGNLHRLRVRRSPAAREKFLPKLKYVWIDGSGTGPLVIRPAGEYRGVVIEEAELDAFATASAHDQVMVIGIGTVAAGLPAPLMEELQDAPVILVALDADPGKDGKLGAGPKAFTAWKSAYRQARFWTVPAGKDPGDYVQQNGDLKLWIEGGLPPLTVPVSSPPPPVKTLAHDQPFSPERAQQGGRGVSGHMVEKIDSKANIERISSGVAKHENKQAAAPEQKNDPIATVINSLPPLERAEVMSAYTIMQGHPVTCWLSPDGLDAGIIDVTGEWRENNRDLSARFTSLFYGPGHEAMCRIFKERFVRNARVYGKCACGKERI